MVQRVDAKAPATERESRVLDLWNENHVFEKSEQFREGQPEWVFYEGPPTANGKPHPGHVLTRIMKDVYPRYRTMKGFHVQRKAGWDTHGLPVEIEIEKKHGISGKKQIQAFGIERFIQECKASVWTYEKTWRELTERMGYWTDLDHPYMTLTDDYIESVWNILQTVYNKDLLYQGHRVSPYCPHCETTLSSHEVAQGYEDVTDLTVTAKFRVVDGVSGQAAQASASAGTGAGGAGAGVSRSADAAKLDAPTFILAWTTTPWTLPSNVALAVHPELNYVLIHSAEHNENYWVAEGLKDNFLHEGDEVLKTATGADLLGTRYEPVFSFVTQPGKKHEVVTSNHVTDESGTGIVHMAPAFGEDDYRVCREHDVIFCNFVDLTGRFTDDVTLFAGRFVRDPDLNVDIVKDLAARNLVYDKQRQEHSYPHCWRCGTGLLYYAIDSWFIRMTDVKDQVLANSNGVNWMPNHIKEGRMGNFLENLVDWNLSRSRYWGTPLPIWVCDKCGERTCIGSRAELKEKAGHLPSELHKPYIDELTWSCSCGGTMTRVPEVIDVWFDSGSMPFAQLHYPFENQEEWKRLFPADYICEAIDQTRGWFYSLLAISTLMTGQAPYRNVMVLGHVLDENGKKMSKSKGNVIDPFEAFDQHGADALRFYFLSNSQPWNSQRFYHRAVAESKSKFIDLLQNVHAFYALYADIDGFNPAEHRVAAADRPLMDRWILSRLHDTIGRVDACLDAYDATSAARAVQALVDDVSTWYVRRNRDRFWASGFDEDKAAAFVTLYEVLEAVAKMAAPMTPFIAEDIYQNLVRSAFPDAPLSVHLCDFPKADEALVDRALLAEMSEVMHVVESGRHLRNETKMKTRQPLSKLYVPREKAEVLGKFGEIIRDELNVKELVFTELADVARAELFLNLKAVGQDYGKLVPVLNKAAKAASAEVVAAFQERGEVTLEGQRIGREHAELRYHPSFEGMIVVDVRGFVGLDTALTPELVEEGYVRELISKMQMMRKAVNYNVTDRVQFTATGDAEVLDILRRNERHIADVVLVRAFEYGDADAGAGQDVQGGAGQGASAASGAGAGSGDLTREWDINGKPLTLTVQK